MITVVIDRKTIYSIIYAALLILSVVYIENKQARLKDIKPPDIDAYIGKHPEQWHEIKMNITRAELQKSILSDYDDISEKIFENDRGERVKIVMTWSKNGIQRAGHIQQHCYTAQGFTIIEPHDVDVVIGSKTITMTAFTAKAIDGTIEDVLYWRITGGKVLQSTTEIDYKDYRLMHRILKMKKLLFSIFSDIPQNIMIRLTTTNISKEKENAILIQYAKNYLKTLTDKERYLLVGF